MFCPESSACLNGKLGGKPDPLFCLLLLIKKFCSLFRIKKREIRKKIKSGWKRHFVPAKFLRARQSLMETKKTLLFSQFQGQILKIWKSSTKILSKAAKMTGKAAYPFLSKSKNANKKKKQKCDESFFRKLFRLFWWRFSKEKGASNKLALYFVNYRKVS